MLNANIIKECSKRYNGSPQYFVVKIFKHVKTYNIFILRYFYLGHPKWVLLLRKSIILSLPSVSIFNIISKSIISRLNINNSLIHKMHQKLILLVSPASKFSRDCSTTRTLVVASHVLTLAVVPLEDPVIISLNTNVPVPALSGFDNVTSGVITYP